MPVRDDCARPAIQPTMPLPQAPADATRLRVLILSDVRLYREGLALRLSRQECLDIVGSAPAADAVVQAAALQPNVALIDGGLVGGGVVPRLLRETVPKIRIVAFAVSEIAEEVLACAEAGLSAYVARDGSAEDLVVAIERAMRGELVCSPRLTAMLFDHVAALSAAKPADPGAPLTPREREIVPLIAQGLSNKEIAQHLRVETATVKNHVHNMLEKLRARRRTEIPLRIRGGGAQRGSVAAP